MMIGLETKHYIYILTACHGKDLFTLATLLSIFILLINFGCNSKLLQ